MALKPGRPTGRTLTHVDRMKQQLIEDEGEMRLNVRMPKAEYQKLKKFAFEKGMNVSEVVRTALKQYMKE